MTKFLDDNRSRGEQARNVKIQLARLQRLITEIKKRQVADRNKISALEARIDRLLAD